MKEIGVDLKWEQRDIKGSPITVEELENMHQLAGSYEALFSRRAMKFRALGLHEKDLSEQDYKKLILEEYTFLKRPVVLANGKIFVGNSKKVVASIVEELS
jgi:arsenate reductase